MQTGQANKAHLAVTEPPAHPLKNGPFSRFFDLLQAARPARWSATWWLLLTVASASWAAKTPAAAPSTPLARCSWDSPGTNPYGGTLAAAVDRYTDIPEPTRAVLKARMASQRYDDIAVIGRSHITGTAAYGPELRDMHFGNGRFGNGRLCRTVTRQRWAAGAEERGLVYCEAGHCIIVPTVCRNVSRVTRRPVVAPQPGVGGGASAATSTGGDAAAAAPAAALLPETAELKFEAPGAGRALGSSSDALAWTGPSTLTLVATGAGLVIAEAQLVALNGSGTFAGSGDGQPGDGYGNGQSNGQDGWQGGASSGTPPQPLSPLSPSHGNGFGWLPGGPQTIASPVPEPGTWALWLLGLATLAAAGRCRRPLRPAGAPLRPPQPAVQRQ